PALVGPATATRQRLQWLLQCRQFLSPSVLRHGHRGIRSGGIGQQAPKNNDNSTPPEPQFSHEYWLNRWQSLTPPDADGGPGAAAWPRWHRPQVHPFLVRHWAALRSGLKPKDEAAEQQQQVLVPLCGASLDLTWLSEQPGVSGVVGVDLGGESVFRRLHLQPPPGRTDLCPGLHRVRSGIVQLYGGDLFHPALRRLEAGQSDLVWDRGSLVVINSADRRAYVALLHSLCRPSHRILLETTVFPRALHPGPPFCVDADQVKALYSDLYDIQLLEAFRDEERRLLYNLPELFYHYYLLTAK
ncbi:hypothetical protein BOX15_Mlig018277g1, partial [Macrostomum lignano]